MDPGRADVRAAHSLTSRSGNGPFTPICLAPPQFTGQPCCRLFEVVNRLVFMAFLGRRGASQTNHGDGNCVQDAKDQTPSVSSRSNGRGSGRGNRGDDEERRCGRSRTSERSCGSADGGRHARPLDDAETRHERQGRRRFHGRLPSLARHRVHGVVPGLDVPRLAGIDRQLRDELEARVHHLPARRDLGRDGARLREDRWQADGDDGAWCGRHAARRDGDLQRLLRSDADAGARRQCRPRQQAPSRRGMGAQRA